MYGCSRVFFKMDLNGNGVLIEQANLYLSLGGKAKDYTIEKYIVSRFFPCPNLQ